MWHTLLGTASPTSPVLIPGGWLGIVIGIGGLFGTAITAYVGLGSYLRSRKTDTVDMMSKFTDGLLADLTRIQVEAQATRAELDRCRTERDGQAKEIIVLKSEAVTIRKRDHPSSGSSAK